MEVIQKNIQAYVFKTPFTLYRIRNVAILI